MERYLIDVSQFLDWTMESFVSTQLLVRRYSYAIEDINVRIFRNLRIKK